MCDSSNMSQYMKLSYGVNNVPNWLFVQRKGNRLNIYSSIKNLQKRRNGLILFDIKEIKLIDVLGDFFSSEAFMVYYDLLINENINANRCFVFTWWRRELYTYKNKAQRMWTIWTIQFCFSYPS